jgi:hypothetical protein
MGEVIHLFARQEAWVDKLTMAGYLGCSKRQVEKWTAEGMPSRMPGNKRVYRMSVCEGWLRENGVLNDEEGAVNVYSSQDVYDASKSTDSENWWAHALECLDAAHRAETSDEAISETQKALMAFYLSVDERPESVLLGTAEYETAAHEPPPECICPPDLVERGGFKGGCPVHA